MALQWGVAQLLSTWNDLSEPPYKLSEGAFKSLIQNLKAAKLEGAAVKANKINADIEKDELAHSAVFSLHNEILRQMNHESAQEVTSVGEDNIAKNSLTGLRNLEQFDKDSNLIFENPALPVSLAFVDMDDLKALNSKILHDAADEVIKQLARLLEDSLNYRAIVYHRSGDEFLIVMKNTASDILGSGLYCWTSV